MASSSVIPTIKLATPTPLTWANDVIALLVKQLNNRAECAEIELDSGMEIGQLLHLIRIGEENNDLIIRVFSWYKSWQIRAVRRSAYLVAGKIDAEELDRVINPFRFTQPCAEHCRTIHNYYGAPVDLGDTVSIQKANKRYFASPQYEARRADRMAREKPR